MQLSFHTLDVFTDTKFGGNPVAIVHGSDQLNAAQMQRIAAEFNLSETVFVAAAKNPAHSASVRIFTPKVEIPFAGHPTIGTAILLAELRQKSSTSDGEALVVLEQPMGIVRVGVRIRKDGVSFAEFDAPKLPQEAGPLPPVDKLSAGLGLIPSEIGFENHRPMCFAAGNTFAMIPIASLDAMERAKVHPMHWADAFEEQGIMGTYLYSRQCIHTTSAFHARMFAPGVGVPEDAATGSAAVCLAGAVHFFDDLPDGTHKRIVEQGYKLDRPSQIAVTLEVAAGRLETVRIGGQAVRISHGTMEL